MKIEEIKKLRLKDLLYMIVYSKQKQDILEEIYNNYKSECLAPKYKVYISPVSSAMFNFIIKNYHLTTNHIVKLYDYIYESYEVANLNYPFNGSKSTIKEITEYILKETKNKNLFILG